jgi:hypothetical protein
VLPIFRIPNKPPPLFSLLQIIHTHDPSEISQLLFGMTDAITKARLNEKEDTHMNNTNVKTGMKIGTLVGGLVFAIFGIVPGFYFGSYGTLIILQKLMGVVEPTLFVRAAVVCGIVIGIASAAVVSLVIGGLIGTALGFIVSAPAAMRQDMSKV